MHEYCLMTRQMSNVVVVCNLNKRNVSLLVSFVYASNAFIYELKMALCATSLLLLSRIRGVLTQRLIIIIFISKK